MPQEQLPFGLKPWEVIETKITLYREENFERMQPDERYIATPLKGAAERCDRDKAAHRILRNQRRYAELKAIADRDWQMHQAQMAAGNPRTEDIAEFFRQNFAGYAAYAWGDHARRRG